jgi:hypothetical protein
MNNDDITNETRNQLVDLIDSRLKAIAADAESSRTNADQAAPVAGYRQHHGADDADDGPTTDAAVGGYRNRRGESSRANVETRADDTAPVGGYRNRKRTGDREV